MVKKDRYIFIFSLVCSVTTVLISGNSEILDIIIMAICMGVIFVLGSITGIEQVKDWERKGSDHWLEFKLEQYKERSRNE